jgi:DNA-binding PadR family transcriptional regulator
MDKESLGPWEHEILLAILRLGSESYSVPIVVELEERTEHRVPPAAVRVTTRRLEKKGLLSSHLETAPPEEGGRLRRYFRLEPEALELLGEYRRILDRLWEGI